jgi:hypothetical protein
MLGVPPEFWEYLAHTSDGLGLLSFLNGLVRYVGQRKAAEEKATIEDYLELARRGEHKEICESVAQSRHAVDALRKFMVQILTESTDRIISELRKEANEIKRLILEQSALPDRPSISVRVSKNLRVATDRNDGERDDPVKSRLLRLN